MKIKKDFEGLCLTCTHFSDIKSSDGRKAKCLKASVIRYEYPENACKHYVNAKRSEDQLKSNYKALKGTRRYYLVTAIMSILKVDIDNCPGYKIIEEFWNNTFLADEIFDEFLAEYDYIGITAADNLLEDERQYELAANYFYTYLIPFINLIKNNEYVKAIQLYVAMIQDLSALYNLETNMNDINTSSVRVRKQKTDLN